jgi:hypothetical protein
MHTNDDTAGALAEAQRYLQKPYTPDGAAAASNAPAAGAPAANPASTTPAEDANKPVLKKRPSSD